MLTLPSAASLRRRHNFLNVTHLGIEMQAGVCDNHGAKPQKEEDRMSRQHVLFALALAAVMLVAAACAPGVPDASKSIARGQIESGNIVPSEQLRVAEYLQYYKQNFPAPVNSTLGLDLRLGNRQVPVEGGTAWLQIGIAAKNADAADIAPLNLALVIDTSGSMNSPEKMPYVKQSLKIFLRSLAANDIVSIITFSTNARVFVPAQKVGDGSWIESAVARLEPDASTNLYDGLMTGFREAERNFDIRRNNRVILLTDGIANVGITDPDRIAADARAYNDRGIYLSTIGLGKDFNDMLLSTLARQGKGGYHFVDSAQEMDKVFHQEVIGLFQKAASDVSIVILPDPSVRVEGLTGYEARPPSGTMQVRLQDMSTGDTQVVLARLSVSSGSSGRRNIATVELHYRDLFSRRDETATQAILAEANRVFNYDPTRDVEVLRNVTIQRNAEGLKEIDRLYKAQRYQDAWQVAYRLEQDLRAVARLTGDAQMVQDADLMREYQDTLAKWVQYQTGRPPQPRERGSGYESDPPIRGGRQVLPTPSLTTIEIR